MSNRVIRGIFPLRWELIFRASRLGTAALAWVLLALAIFQELTITSVCILLKDVISLWIQTQENLKMPA